MSTVPDVDVVVCSASLDSGVASARVTVTNRGTTIVVVARITTRFCKTLQIAGQSRRLCWSIDFRIRQVFDGQLRDFGPLELAPGQAEELELRTGKELQEARAAASDRFQEVGLAMLKEAGVKTWEFHEKGLQGHAWADRKHVSCPKPTTRRRLYILAHECGHVALNHGCSKPSHRKEFEAEQYAHSALRKHKVPVPKKETDRAKSYVAHRIDQAIRMGKAKKLDREAVDWCRAKHRAATKRALRNESVELVDLCGGRKKKANSQKRGKDKSPIAQRRSGIP